jgi:CRP-like cAMP-binding protein
MAQNRSMVDIVGSRETLPRAFPALTKEQIDRIRPLGHNHQVQSGDILFKPGDTAVPFYVMLSGRMEIVQPTLDGERMIAVHEAGEFTGENFSRAAGHDQARQPRGSRYRCGQSGLDA